MSKLLIRRCAYCDEEFFTENPRGLYCCNACTGPAIRVRNLFKAYPVKSLGNWEFHVRRILRLVGKRARSSKRVIDCLPSAQWDDLIVLISEPYRFWDSVGDIEMGEVIERYAEPIEALLDLPARAPIQGMTAAKVLDWIRDTSKGKYSFLEEGTDGKTA